MKKVSLVLALIIGLTYSAFAGPQVLCYQGSLLLPDGAPVADGTYAVRFAIYDSKTGGTQLWGETDASVSVVNGSFSTMLGDGSAFDNLLSGNIFAGGVFAGTPALWLEVAVDLDRDSTFAPSEVYSPRQELTSCAWAMNADRLGGLRAGDFATSGHAHNASDITTGTLGDDRLSTYVTVQGNTFNGPSQLVRLDSFGRLPALDGSLLTGLSGDKSRTTSTTDGKGGTYSTLYTGSGTANYATKWTGTDSLGNSIIYDNGSRIGIGTASPAGLFQVLAQASPAKHLLFNDNILTVRSDDNSNPPTIALRDEAGYGLGYIDFYTYGGATVPAARWQGLDTGGASGAHILYTATGTWPSMSLAERFRIAANGTITMDKDYGTFSLDAVNHWIGIRTKYPHGMLTIDSGRSDGQGGAAYGLVFQSSVSGGQAAIYGDGTAGGWGDLVFATNSVAGGYTFAEKMRLKNSGNVRVLSGMKIYPSANSTTAINIANAAQTSFVTFDTTNQRVGIGTTAPGQKLSVAGTIESSSGGFKFPDGSVQTVAASGSGLTGSGTANYMTKWTGTSSLDNSTIYDNGNIGIGTTGPGEKLHVIAGVGGGIVSDLNDDAYNSTWGRWVKIGAPEQTAYGVIGTEMWYGSDYAFFGLKGSTEDSQDAVIQWGNDGTEKLILAYGDASAPTEAMAIANGQVGIGTVSPTAGVDVRTAMTASGGSAIGSQFTQTLTASANNDVLAALRIAPTFAPGSYTGVKEYGLIVESGKVGIGTPSPTAGLDVQTAVTAASPAVGVQFAQNLIASNNNDVLTALRIAPTFTPGSYTGVKEYGLIVESGKVGIGTATPQFPLDVVGDLNISGSYCIGGVPVSVIGGSGTDNYVPTFTGPTTLGNSSIYDSGGNIGIGTLTPAYPLHVVGDVNVTGSYRVNGTPLSGGIGGSGTTSYVPLFASGTTLEDSVIYQSGSYIGIGTASPGYPLTVNGTVQSLSGGFRFPDGTLQSTAATGDGITGSGTANYVTKWTDSDSVGNSSIYDIGYVGIGMYPSYQLDVASGGDYTARLGQYSWDSVVVGGGSGTVHAGTYDPIFDIDGEKYATFLPDYAGGTRVETSGIAMFSKEKPTSEIDFDNLEKGSDLWLFWKASSKSISDVVVILTPGFQGKAWYEKVGNKIIIHADESGEVSFRLSAPRIDHQKWPNLASDQTLSGIKVPSQ